jgi:hypothetical protein
MIVAFEAELLEEKRKTRAVLVLRFEHLTVLHAAFWQYSTNLAAKKAQPDVTSWKCFSIPLANPEWTSVTLVLF